MSGDLWLARAIDALRAHRCYTLGFGDSVRQLPTYQFVVITSALSLARQLWRYGEPDLAERAFRLPAEDVANIGYRIGMLHLSGDSDRLWPDGPRDKAEILAVVEWLERSPRPSTRARRLPEKRLPLHLQATEAERLQAATEVADAVERFRHEGRVPPRALASLQHESCIIAQVTLAHAAATRRPRSRPSRPAGVVTFSEGTRLTRWRGHRPLGELDPCGRHPHF